MQSFEKFSTMSISTKEAQLGRNDAGDAGDTYRWVIIPSFELRRSRLALEIDSYNKVRTSWNFIQHTTGENES